MSRLSFFPVLLYRIFLYYLHIQHFIFLAADHTLSAKSALRV